MAAEEDGWEELAWKQLADRVYYRRRSRGIRSRGVFAAKAGVSERTLGQLERGLPVGRKTLLAVDAALFWVAGSCERILHGEEPLDWPQMAPGFWDDSGEATVTERNPRPEGEIDRSSVGAGGEADYVTEGGAPGEDEPALLAEIADAARRLAELTERLLTRDRRS